MADARIICGADIRRTQWGPEDTARVEGFVARYGGSVSIATVGDAAVAVTWDAAPGPSVTATGSTFGEAFHALSVRVLA